jgi:hypothetical protein
MRKGRDDVSIMRAINALVQHKHVNYIWQRVKYHAVTVQRSIVKKGKVVPAPN